MNKIKLFFTVFIASVLLLVNFAISATAVAPWNVTGNYEITFFLDGDLSATPYVHHATLAQSSTTVTGDGGFPASGGDTFHWNVTSGTQTADTLSLTVAYDLGAAGTIMSMTGTVAPDGTVSGTWTDDFGGTRTGTWSITKGVSVPLIHTPGNGVTVTQSALIKVDWTDSTGFNPPFEYQYEAFSDAIYTSSVYLSGWLSASEIPTPGTPPGDYYLRVKAKNSSPDESAWSNDAINPYHIKVTADPINPFPVPLECNQSVAYNFIEGTNGSEILNGTGGPDLILAKGSSDIVNGNGGNDCIVGGTGGDDLKGGAGNDVILGGTDGDSLSGNAGQDDLYGEDGNDALNGNAGNDDLWGGIGSDSLKGETGNDMLDGQQGSDYANGGAATDTCSAEAETQCEL